jgi:3-phosphoshikimate 1-carboxyvinyltransferase
MSHVIAPKPLTAKRCGPLKGLVRPPGDKSISHRAFLLGLLSLGETRVSGLLEGEDVLNTGRACAQLGAKIERTGEGQWSIRGVGLGALLTPADTLDFGNAGTGSRLMMGVVGGHGITARFDGDASLRKRPMRRILDPLVLMGAEVLEQTEGGRCPILLKGTPDPAPIEYRTPVASAQIKSAVLLAGLNARGRTTVIESEASRDHTEKMLAYFGATLTSEPFGEHGRKITLEGRPELTPRPIAVPVDPSSAAFLIAAALLVEGSDVVVEGVMMNPLRIGFVTTLVEMGANIEILESREEGGEQVADLRVRHSALTGVDVPADRAPAMIDEYIILAVVAAFAKGVTRMNGLQELRVKESDRLAATAAGLLANGVAARVEGDDLIVEGAGLCPGGGLVETHLDHRLAMSFLVMGLAAQKPVTVDDEAMIATSFPTFKPMLVQLGAEFL